MKGVFWFLVTGLLAGWLAGVLMRGRGFGVVGDMAVGMIGAVLGGCLFGMLGLTAYGFTGALIMAAIGAAALLVSVSVVKRG